ncbi:hypothetical protein C8T65DRAFT_756259 [Cerioporus squamosus]|nr:hypothetical protein C8T65DRAFT_756259 [Cerioporus squamosus]
MTTTPGPIRNASNAAARTHAHPYPRIDALAGSPGLGGHSELPATANTRYNTPTSAHGSPFTGPGEVDVQFPLAGSTAAAQGALAQHRPPNSVGRTSNFAPSTPISPSHMNSIDIDLLITQHGQDGLRNFVHMFSMMPTDDKLVHLLLHLLDTDQRVREVVAAQNQIQLRLGRMEQLVRLAWRPTEPQEKLLRAIIRHYLIQPVGSYLDVGPIAKDYLRDPNHAKKLRLELYNTDQTVAHTVDEFIKKEVGQLKSALRKAIFNSCKNNISLAATSRNLVDNYHLPIIPKVVPDSIQATIALLREIAKPLAVKTNRRGGDTGFWGDVEERLEKEYNTNGKDRTTGGEAWLEWEKTMIEADEKLFEGSTGRRRRGRAAPQTRAELDAAMGEGIEGYGNQWDNEDTAVPEGGGDAPLTMSSLGNMAETATLPTL